MTHYQHTQLAGWIIWLPTLICIFLTAYAGFVLSNVVSLIVFAVMLIVLVLFYCLRVIIDDDYLRISFGIGLIRFRFKLNEIDAHSIVKNKWWYGWGIRLGPDGWLYNIGGLDAILVKLGDGRSVRIGTNAPDELNRALQQRLANLQK